MYVTGNNPNYFPTNLHSFHMLHIKHAALKQICSFAHGLLWTHNLAKHIILQYTLLHSLSVPVLLYKTRPDKINYEATSLKYDECVCILVLVFRHVQDISSMQHYNMCAWPVWLYTFFCIITYMAQFSENIYWTQSVFWFSWQILSETFLILWKIQRAIIINVQVKQLLILADFNETWIFDTFPSNIHMPNFINICQVVAQLFHAGGQGDRMNRHGEANSPFLEFFGCT